MEGQTEIWDTLFNLEDGEEMTPAQEYYKETGRTTYWQDSDGKPYGFWRKDGKACLNK